jgi:hypothetical protein
MFRSREAAGFALADRLRGRSFANPLVLAVPRGGVVVGAVLASELRAELDVTLARKLGSPANPEFAVGAVGEDGNLVLNPDAIALPGVTKEYLEAERDRQRAEIARRAELFRAVRPAADVAGRAVIVVDDGVATGSTVLAALRTVRPKGPKELILAVPVVSPDRVEELAGWCDELVYLHAPPDFAAVGNSYADFTQVEDDQVVQLLRDVNRAKRA